MLGSLIAGGTFCPVDVTTPEARNATICTDFAPHVVLYENTPPSFLSALPVTTPTADMLKPPTTRLANPATDHSDVAYVHIYIRLHRSSKGRTDKPTKLFPFP